MIARKNYVTDCVVTFVKHSYSPARLGRLSDSEMETLGKAAYKSCT
jgi:hypothetical protein